MKTSALQRMPLAGEPVCVVCGKYGEYICDQTETDVCSLECKTKHLEEVKSEVASLCTNDFKKSISEAKSPFFALSRRCYHQQID